MAITSNIINSILDTMRYRTIDAIEIVKDEHAEDVTVITFMNSSNIIEHVYYIDNVMNKIMFNIERVEYHESFNDDNDDTKFYDVYFNKYYLDDARVIHFIDDWFKSFTNQYQSIDDKTYSTNNYYFTNIVQLFWHNAEYIYNDNYTHILSFDLLCDYMDTCHINMEIIENECIDYRI